MLKHRFADEAISSLRRGDCSSSRERCSRRSTQVSQKPLAMTRVRNVSYKFGYVSNLSRLLSEPLQRWFPRGNDLQQTFEEAALAWTLAHLGLDYISFTLDEALYALQVG